MDVRRRRAAGWNAPQVVRRWRGDRARRVSAPGGSQIVRWEDPERARLLAELGMVTEALAAARLELEDVEARRQHVTRFHDRLLAPRYARLDELKAQIAELLAVRGHSAEDRRDAAAARHRARWSARAAQDATAGDGGEPAGTPRRSQPSDQVRRLFRALIKLCRPDLAGDARERRRRELFTRRVNQAYADEDAAR